MQGAIMTTNIVRNLLRIVLAVMVGFGVQAPSLANGITIVDFEVISAPDAGYDFLFVIPPDQQFSPAEGIGITTRGFNYTPGPLNRYGYNDLHIANQHTTLTPLNVYFPYNGTTIGGTHDDVVLTHEDALPFNLFQFDFAGYMTGGLVVYENQIKVIGTYAGGGTVMETFTPDGTVDGMGGVADFQTFALASGEGWYNLTSVIFEHLNGAPKDLAITQGSFALDNIQVQVVPELSTWLLFAAGLLIIMAFHTTGSRNALRA